MKGYNINNDEIVIAGALRTPIGQVNKSLADFLSYELGSLVAGKLIEKIGLDKKEIGGVVAAEIGQSSKSPNIARVISVKLGLPLEIPAITVANNCVSSFEACADAIRRVVLGEGDVQLVIGTESMSKFPLYLDGARQNSKFATVEKALKNISELAAGGDQDTENPVKLVDGIIEGLTDPVRDANMIETGEIAAQNYNFTQEELDKVAAASYSNALKALENGKYDKFIVPVEANGKILDKDEYIMSKKGFVEKPARFSKASPVFEHPSMGGMENFYKKFASYINKPYDKSIKGAVTLFNSCPQSDGAGALIVTTLSKARELNLPVLAKVVSYAMAGVDPVYMGIGMAYAGKKALEKSGLTLADIGFFEVHEAFAATFLGTIHELTDKLGLDLKTRLEMGDINRNGGTLALGHPLGATGIRVLINQILEFDYDTKSNYSMGTICAGGGVAGSFILQRPYTVKS